MPPEPVFTIKDVYKIFYTPDRRDQRSTFAVRGVSLDIYPGTFVTFVGPSGCGKSTLLNMMSGLTFPSDGQILFRGQPIRKTNYQIGYITQHDNLLPWRTLLGNVQLALEYRGVPKPEREERARALINKVGLSGFESYYPRELSGGMRQRANLIRTLVYDPEVILMDEPFGALDAQTRLVLQDELLKLWSGSGKTIVFVTHDLVESIALSDQIVVFTQSPGEIKAIYDVPLKRPRDVFHIHKSEGFTETYDRVWVDLQQVLARAGLVKTGDGAAVQKGG
ncbi:MAG: ABC transporter ATP-binding protein [Firmicutes bacterium]|nr:ABC transporter ATP-binding protein [Bacillota bacterium]